MLAQASAQAADGPVIRAPADHMAPRAYKLQRRRQGSPCTPHTAHPRVQYREPLPAQMNETKIDSLGTTDIGDGVQVVRNIDDQLCTAFRGDGAINLTEPRRARPTGNRLQPLHHCSPEVACRCGAAARAQLTRLQLLGGKVREFSGDKN